MQRFFTDTIESRFIKWLLHETFLPVIPTVNKNDYLFEGKTYIYKNSIIECISPGYLVSEPSIFDGTGDLNFDGYINSDDVTILARHVANIEHITDPEVLRRADINKDGNVNAIDMTLLAKMAAQNLSIAQPESAQIVKKLTYIPYSLYPKFCNRFVSNNYFYDSNTHKRLGKFLRFYRDMTDIDLMPFYNCYAGESINNIHLSKSNYYFEKDDSVKTYKIPIKFNKTYTIAIDASSTVTVAPAILINDQLGVVNDVNLNTVVISDSTTNLCKLTKIYYNLSFKNPITFKVTCNNSDFIGYEQYLNLLIQVPSTNTSSMVVLEGDYRFPNKNVIMNLDGQNEFEDFYMNNSLISSLQLLQINDNVRYAFSDRLIEYLLWNVITSRETLGMNIQRVQLAPINTTYPATPLGIWVPEMRYKLYKAYMNDNSTRKLDINGFVDVNMEKYINKL